MDKTQDPDAVQLLMSSKHSHHAFNSSLFFSVISLFKPNPDASITMLAYGNLSSASQCNYTVDTFHECHNLHEITHFTVIIVGIWSSNIRKVKKTCTIKF